MKLKKVLSVALLTVIMLSQLTFIKVNNVVFAVDSNKAAKNETNYNRYYYNQLVENSKNGAKDEQKKKISKIAVGIYDAMYEMYVNGIFKTGNADYNLTRSGHVQAEDLEDKNTLLSAYGAARDAFQYDWPDVFYVDFSYLTIRVATNSEGTFAYLGTGRKDTYFLPGFTADNVDAAIKTYEEKIEKIVANAKAVKDDEDGDGDLTEEKATFVHDYLTQHMIYHYEDEVKGGNARTAFDALNYEEGVCEAYSRAYKAILDRLGIPCVVVAGVYRTETLNEPHAWNYVLLPDGVWYGVDVTQDDPTNKAWKDKKSGHETREFCLVGQSELAGHHIPVGVLSEANYEFSYPGLALEAPRETTLYVNESLDSELKVKLVEDTYQDEEGNLKSGTMLVSYRGKNYTDNAKEGYYILAKCYQYDAEKDSWTEMDWGYIEPTIYSSHDSIGFEPETEDKDLGKYVRLPFPHVMRAQFAVTTIPPDTSEMGILKGGLYYHGDPKLLTEVSPVIENKWGDYVAPPYPTKVTPYQGSTLDIRSGGTYHVKAIYDDVLVEDSDPKTTPGIKISCRSFNADEGASTGEDHSKIEHFQHNGDTIEFDFTPSQQYADNMCYYTMQIEGLIGQKSKKKPFYLSYGCTYPCAACAFKAQGFDWNVMGQPQLLDSSDMSTDQWKAKDDSEVNITEKITHRLTLVTTEPSPLQDKEMQDIVGDEIGDDGQVLATSTYNIALTLCKKQVVSTGQGVRVCVGFPKGYSYESFKQGTSFKAYHYKVDDRGKLTGEVEEINCEVTKLGLIITCTSFSPFAISAVKLNTPEVSQNTDKTIVVTSPTNGKITNEDGTNVTNLNLKSGKTQKLKIVPEDGYQIDKVMVNGVETKVEADGTITIAYDEYPDDTTIIVTASFVTKQVAEKEEKIQEVKLLTADDINVTVDKTTIKPEEVATIQVEKISTEEGTEEINLVTYHSSDDTVASVSEKGKVTALKPGKVTITVTVNGDIIKTIEITVQETSEDVIEATKVTLNKTTIELSKGTFETLLATVEPEGSTDKVVWTSSNEKIASVDKEGKVTAVSGGRAIITATAGNQSASCTVTVKVPLEDVSIEREQTGNLLKGKIAQLTAKLNPTDVFPLPENSDYTWSVEPEDVVSLSSTNGNQIDAKGLKAGTATITLAVGGKSNTYEITVEEVSLAGAEIDREDFELRRGKTEQLHILLTPENATDEYTVTWKSSNSDIVSVDENGKATANTIGEATITATVTKEDGTTYTSTVKVTVPEVKLEEVKIKADKTELNVGDKLNLSFEVLPEDTTTIIEKVEWKSSDDTIVSVSKSGEITALKEGTATITLICNDKYVSSVDFKVVNTPTAAPQTGDIAIEAFAILMVVSLAGIVFVVIKRNKKTK